MSKKLFILTLFAISFSTFAADLYPPEEEMSQAQKILFKSAPLQVIDTNKGLDTIISFPNGAGNAAENYSKLNELFKEDRLPGPYIDIKTNNQGVKEIFKATTKKECDLAPYFPFMDKATVRQPDIIVFLTYLNSMFDIADALEGRGDIKGAEAIHQRAFIYGWQLTQEPTTIVSLMLGVAIKREAAEQYSSFLFRKMDMKGSDQAREYKEYLEEVGFRFNRIQNFFLGSVTNFNSLFSSIKIATESESIVWRQQAILILGLYRFGVVNGDGEIIATDEKMQKYAENALVYIAENGKTKTERELAAWTTQKLTPELFVKINKNMELSPYDIGNK